MNETPPIYVLLDFETTGLDSSSAEIIEVGALKVRGLEVIDRYHALVRPEGQIPYAISQLTGITPETVADAPPLSDVLPGFAEFLGGLPIVAHNAKLEQAFLDHFVSPFTATSYTVHNSIDPLALVLPDHSSHSMESLRKWAGIVAENAHRADVDCEDTLKVLEFARGYLLRERPHLCAIVRGMLPDWWWSWYFETGESPARTPARAFLGDLKSLKDQDASREIDWSQAIPESAVRGALRAEAAPEEIRARFQHRETQEQMALEVRQALVQGSRIAIEAPTGTGKSVAYLVPGILAARASGAPLVVSTHSKGLQDQLLEKDIPIVRKLTNEPELRATTVKGQENYLCLRKLGDVLSGVLPEDSIEDRWAAGYLAAFASVSQAAELDRVSHYLQTQNPGLERLIDQVRSHHTTTIGPTCPFYRECHYFNSARLAHQSDVIIANHALVFQWPAHLPQIRNIVFDEAHHLEDQITEAYSVKLGEEELSDALDRLARKSSSRRPGDIKQIARLLDRLKLIPPYDVSDPQSHVVELCETARTRLFELRSLVPLAVPKGKDGAEGYDQIIQLGLKSRAQAEGPMMEGFRNLASALAGLRDYLAAGVEAAEKAGVRADAALDLLKLHANRFHDSEEKVQSVLATEDPNLLRIVYWSARESVWRFSVAPIEVQSLTEEFFGSKRGVVLTSATLSTGGQSGTQDFVTSRIGLAPSKPLISLPSPYRLDEQARIFIPGDIAPPGTAAHLEALIQFTEAVATALGGRTLLLMTSNRRLKQAAETLHSRLTPRGITVFDSVSDRRAAEHFRATERALLVGSERYGEGLDIPGRALTCVVIEKINEAMTRSPLAEARKARTRFGLYDYDFPLRMMWLKQRVGRLIRSAEDTGAVVIFDPRYQGWSPGSRAHVDRALAPMPIRTGTREQIIGAIEQAFGE